MDRIFSIDQRRQKFTVYFIPTVQYRVKQYMTCQSCREHFEIADDLKTQIAERLMTEKQLKTVLSEMTGGQNALLPLCKTCSQSVDSGMRFCPNCGSPQK
ncbi:MAG: zinc-ribbon domain-containing protein [Dehalococcoidia bacterium]|nr:MAG: zinc-ribbon domain-containing protein [Dehalococcoidia bacterium]